MTDPIAYTYEADTHCEGCAIARFGKDSHGYPPESAEDREGNGLGAVFSWTEWHECDDSPDSSHVLTCGTCGGEIERCEYAPEVPGSRWIETGHDPEAEDRAYLERPTDIDLYA